MEFLDFGEIFRGAERPSNTKSGRHTHIRDMRLRGGALPEGSGDMLQQEKFNFQRDLTTFKTLLLLFETNCNQLDLLHLYINV